MANRWWVYQKERFPLIAHGPLVAVFSYSALSYSALLRHQAHAPGPVPAMAAFFTSLLIFLQLRIADEFKDFDDDSRYRPYRPVPRGLIKLRELAIVFVGAGAIQLAIAIRYNAPLTLLLFVVWAYLALMSNEFFARSWLKAHPFTYLWSHMLIMPQVDFYVTACNWMPAAGRFWNPPAGLAWFLIISFFNGIVLEFGRKIRAPEDEEEGVDTYTALWGRNVAVGGWLLALCLTWICVLQASMRLQVVQFGSMHIRFVIVSGSLTLSMLAVAALSGLAFLRSPSTRLARRVEMLSGLWTVLMYLSLGVVPRLFR